MTRDDIIRMARDAGFSTDSDDVWITDGYWLKELECFAALVAAAEREACAKVCDSIDTYGDRAECWTEYAAELIRARGQQ